MGIAGAGNSGTVLTTLAAPRLAEHVGWHAVFGLALIPVAARLGRVRAAGEGAAARRRGRLTRARPRRDARARRDAWRLCGLYAVTFGAFVGLASFLPIFFHDQYGLSKVDAATIAAVGGAARLAAAPVRRPPRRPPRRARRC